LYRHQQVVEPVLQRDGGSIYYINLSQDDFKLGGSSFADFEYYRERCTNN
jgi:hypothetical protein